MMRALLAAAVLLPSLAAAQTPTVSITGTCIPEQAFYRLLVDFDGRPVAQWTDSGGDRWTMWETAIGWRLVVAHDAGGGTMVCIVGVGPDPNDKGT